MKLFKRKKGQGTTEYVLIVAGIAMAAFIVVKYFISYRLRNAADTAGAAVEEMVGESTTH